MNFSESYEDRHKEVVLKIKNGSPTITSRNLGWGEMVITINRDERRTTYRNNYGKVMDVIVDKVE